MCVTLFHEHARLGGLSVSRCDGSFANGLQAANDLCFAIRGSLVADHQMRPLCLRAAADRSRSRDQGQDLASGAAFPPPGRGQAGWRTAACWCRRGGTVGSPPSPGAHHTVGVSVLGGLRSAIWSTRGHRAEGLFALSSQPLPGRGWQEVSGDRQGARRPSTRRIRQAPFL